MVEGVGINDVDYVVELRQELPRVGGKRVRKLLWRCPFYQAWRNMLLRCYNKKYQRNNPTYEGTSVCALWLYFSNFRAWMEQQDWEGNQLDKDILITGNREYSPEACSFVDKFTNMFVVDALANKGTSLPGVYWNKNEERFMAQISIPKFIDKNGYLGYYDNEYEAHKAYLKAKAECAVILASRQSDVRVSEALLKRFVV